MAQHAVASRPMSVRLACVAFSISETCYRYQGKFNDENSYIANLPIGLTEEQSDWGGCVSLI
jgi:putative transposase